MRKTAPPSRPIDPQRHLKTSHVPPQRQLTSGKKSLPKVAPAADALRAWANSARRSRNKSWTPFLYPHSSRTLRRYIRSICPIPTPSP